MLRDYQTRTCAAVLGALAYTAQGVALVAPTGSGKTVMGCEVAANHPGPVLWVAHTREIIGQTIAKLTAHGVHRGVSVISIQSLLDGERPAAALLIADECHHLRGSAWRNVALHYRAQGSRILGLTATPDGDGLAQIFDDLIVAATFAELLAAGHLVPATVIGPRARRRSTIAEDPAIAYVSHAAGLPAIIYCPNVENARFHAEGLTRAGYTAECIDGEMTITDRDAAIARYRSGETTVLTGCNILTEGFDAPHTAAVIIARACTTPALYLQIVGRALRPSPGKTRALVIDLVGAWCEHGLPTEERVYSLSPHPISSLATLPPIRQCKHCGAVYRVGPVACARCGAKHPPPPAPKLSREELQIIHAAESVEDKRAQWIRLVTEARTRGFHMGWAVARFEGRYGHPPRF